MTGRLNSTELRDLAYRFTRDETCEQDFDQLAVLPINQQAYVVGYVDGRIDSACIRVLGAPIREIMDRKQEATKPQSAWADFCDALKEPLILAVKLVVFGLFGIAGYFVLSGLIDLIIQRGGK